MSVKNRHEPVPQPEGQRASRPVRLVTQPSPVCFLRPRASRSSSRGRGVGPVFRLFAPSFSSLFFRFSVLVSLGFSWSRGCAVATPAIRGVSRSGCAASPSSGKVPPDSCGQWHQGLRAPTQKPRFLSGIPSVRMQYCRFLLGCSGTAVFIVSTLGAVCPCPRTTGCGRNSPVHTHELFSKFCLNQ